MKYKAFALAAVTALTTFTASAQVATTGIAAVSGSFDSVSLGELTLPTASNVMGALGYAIGSYVFSLPTFGAVTVTHSPISFTGLSLTNILPGSAPLLANSALPTFSFNNLAAGTYKIAISGSVAGSGAAIGQYSVTAVPEPETFAMLLAGLGLMGTIARRRKTQYLAG